MKKQYKKPFFEVLPLNEADDCILASAIGGDVIVGPGSDWTSNSMQNPEDSSN